MAVAFIWTECDQSTDDAILGYGTAPGVVEQTRSIFCLPKHRTRRELPILCEACLDLAGGVGGVAVAMSGAEQDPLEVEGAGVPLSVID